jgi:hypothetical protein
MVELITGAEARFLRHRPPVPELNLHGDEDTPIPAVEIEAFAAAGRHAAAPYLVSASAPASWRTPAGIRRSAARRWPASRATSRPERQPGATAPRPWSERRR